MAKEVCSLMVPKPRLTSRRTPCSSSSSSSWRTAIELSIRLAFTFALPLSGGTP